MEVKEIGKLLEFIAKSGLEEVHVETGELKLTVKKNVPIIQQVVPELMPVSPALTTATQVVPRLLPDDVNGELTYSSYVTFKAPMVGTFYQSSDPGAPPFVQVGDRIQRGQRLCVIEAMKLFNDIEADITGTIVKILVDDASPVEYEQPLFIIDPK